MNRIKWKPIWKEASRQRENNPTGKININAIIQKEVQKQGFKVEWKKVWKDFVSLSLLNKNTHQKLIPKLVNKYKVI